MASCRPRATSRALLAAVAVVALGTGMAGCGEEIAETLTEQATGIDVEIGEPPPSPPAAAEADDEAERDGGAYPDALPEQLPLPDGMELVDSSVEETEDGTRVTLETVDLDDFDQAVLFYEVELAAAGWTVVDEVESNDDGVPTRRWEIEGFGWNGSLELRREGETRDLGGTTTRLLVELTRSS